MSYKPPHVSIFQILNRASQNLVDSELLPTYVGSLNQVVNKTPINLTYPVTNTTINYIGLKVGAIINNTKVKIIVDNALVEVKTSATAVGVFTAGSKTITGSFTNVKAGDIVKLLAQTTFTVIGSYIVEEATSTTLTFTKVIDHTATTGETYRIERLIESVEADFGTATFSLSSFTITQLEYDNMNILGGSASLSYVALRKDLTGFYEVTNPDQLQIDMDIDPESGIGFYLGQIAQIANGGRTLLAYITPDNLLSSFTSAWSELAIRKDVYFIVPISESQSVCGGASSHAVAMSVPDISYFRMALVNAPITLTKTLVSNQTFAKA